MGLENPLGTTDAVELARQEERISKKQALTLFETPVLDVVSVGSVAALRAIHRHLFGEIYGFAGQIRSVNLSKGNFRFASVLYLDSALQKIEQMPQSTFEEIIEKYMEMNIAHPFREGNGRSMRLWLDQILKQELGQVVDWSVVDREDYPLAMERSPVRDVEIKRLLRAALTPDTHNRELFMKGIDHSYAYEGYSAYKAEEL